MRLGCPSYHEGGQMHREYFSKMALWKTIITIKWLQEDNAGESGHLGDFFNKGLLAHRTVMPSLGVM